MPVPMRLLLTGHDVFTVAFMGWKRVRNGRLLSQAAAAGFDALVTTDGRIEHQQNPTTLPLAVVVLDAPSNDMSDLAPLAGPLLAALTTLTPRSVRQSRSPYGTFGGPGTPQSTNRNSLLFRITRQALAMPCFAA